MINKYLKPIFNSADISQDLIMISCSLGYKNNVTITNASGRIIHKFTIGYEVIDVQTNKNHELWVTYSDVGINSGFLEDAPNIEASGLNCFDPFGNIVYKYNDKPYIDEGRSLNVVSENETLINIYAGMVKSGTALGIITNKKVSKIMEWGEFTRFFAYWDNKVLVERREQSGKVKSRFALLDIEKRTDIEIFEFFNGEGEKLNCIHGQGDRLTKNRAILYQSIPRLPVGI